MAYPTELVDGFLERRDALRAVQVRAIGMDFNLYGGDFTLSYLWAVFEQPVMHLKNQIVNGQGLVYFPPHTNMQNHDDEHPHQKQVLIDLTKQDNMLLKTVHRQLEQFVDYYIDYDAYSFGGKAWFDLVELVGLIRGQYEIIGTSPGLHTIAPDPLLLEDIRKHEALRLKSTVSAPSFEEIISLGLS